eukprot:CAMPEP_0197896574 /NCGR_PEP_ID=MMETSP1439-20131203/40237_1 /TAXON_ID=66791 /ORGANISM="Gonyaulax spinifera, Strain CCMP409" /LENGTH=102 /DNA_ID=CAMNT_0043517117 /DNA_START=69 /DNA_END=377 /DNA_ORIENTATION=+
MARASAVTLLCTCGLAALLCITMGSAVLSFVGSTAPASNLRGSVAGRVPDVAMHFFGGPPPTTTTPAPEPIADVNYVLGITAFFFAALAANAAGFFNSPIGS